MAHGAKYFVDGWTEVVVSNAGPPPAGLKPGQAININTDLQSMHVDLFQPIDDSHRGDENGNNPCFVILTRLPTYVNKACPSVEELIALMNDKFGGQVPDGWLFSSERQQQLLGPFAPEGEVIPFIKTPDSNVPYMDLRFAPFLDGPTPESETLDELGHVTLLEAAAAGKSRAIFDLGRRRHLVYIRCCEEDKPPPSNPMQCDASEFPVLQEKIFPRVIQLINKHCDTRRLKILDDARATGFILADLCARLCLWLWYASTAATKDPETFLVSQLGTGQAIMLSVFEELAFCTPSDLKELLCDLHSRRYGNIHLRFVLDDAQVVARKFATAAAPAHFLRTPGSTHPRSLLHLYVQLLKQELSTSQIIVAGTDIITGDAKVQVAPQLWKSLRGTIGFPVLDESAVQERLARVLNVQDVDWSKVSNLSQVTGRCGWCVQLLHMIVAKLKRDGIRGSKEQFLVSCIAELQTQVASQMADAAATRLSSATISDETRYRDERLLKTVFALCTLFRRLSRAVRVLLSDFDVTPLLSTGFGQLASHEGQLSKHVVFDQMTAAAVTLLAQRSEHQWRVESVIASRLRCQSDVSSSERGLTFRLLIAAALFEFRGTVADLARAVVTKEAQAKVDAAAREAEVKVEAATIAAAGAATGLAASTARRVAVKTALTALTAVAAAVTAEATELSHKLDEVLPMWCHDAPLQATGFASFDNSLDVRDFFRDPTQVIGIVCEPDSRHRVDGMMIGQRDSAPFELAYSGNLWAPSLPGAARSDDMSSTCLERAYQILPKPSADSSKAAKPQKIYETIEQAQALWASEVYPKIFALTQGRRLRLHVNIPGYSRYASDTVGGEYDVGVGKDNCVKKVHVIPGVAPDGTEDPMKGEVRIIIDRDNYDVLFQDDIAREAIRSIIEQNDQHLRQQQQQCSKRKREAQRKRKNRTDG